jgi:hypothetical protein
MADQAYISLHIASRKFLLELRPQDRAQDSATLVTATVAAYQDCDVRDGFWGRQGCRAGLMAGEGGFLGGGEG